MLPTLCEGDLLLVRHGESAPFVEGRPFPLVGGHADPSLHPDGHAQAGEVARTRADADGVAEADLVAAHRAQVVRAAAAVEPVDVDDFVDPRELLGKIAAGSPIPMPPETLDATEYDDYVEMTEGQTNGRRNVFALRVEGAIPAATVLKG